MRPGGRCRRCLRFSTVERGRRLILDEIKPLQARADPYVGLRVLSAIRYPSGLVSQILQKRELMMESPVYREIREEGREEGRLAGLLDDVLAALEVRFGSVPEALADQVRRRRGRPELERLRRAIVVEKPGDADARAGMTDR